MAHSSRTRARDQEARRRRHKFRIEAIQALESRQLLAPFLPTGIRTAEFDPFDDQPPTQNFGSVTVTFTQDGSNIFSAAPFVSVSQLTPISSFGGDMVRIEAGPGGPFGKGVYAISRGTNDGGPPVTLGGNPGVIYRVDPATGESSVFFDLNTVIDQRTPSSDASDSAGIETGLLNWYDITFDPEGFFSGVPSMFVSSVDRTNPEKNLIYQIGPDGTLLGVFATFTEGLDVGAMVRRPSAIHVPSVEQQRFLRGMVVGSGTNNLAFTALFFEANEYTPGQNIEGPLPPGVVPTPLNRGPEVGLTSANTDYVSQIYSAFTDFGQPGIPGFSPPNPGLSGVQGIRGGELLIRNNSGVGFQGVNIGTFIIGPFPENVVEIAQDQANGTDPSGIDRLSAVDTPYRRFQDITFDHYGYFSYGTTVDLVEGSLPTIGEPTYAGSVFVADLASGLSVPVDLPEDFPLDGTVVLPVQGPGFAGVNIDPLGPGGLGFQLPGTNLGGRIIRILPDGTVNTFAEGFNTSGDYFLGSFVESSLSITFSADGTTLYAADNDGIWQFQSTLSLAGSTSGIVTGLNDLRTMGVPFDGQDSAVAVIDSGVDARTPNFRGRIAEGANVVTGGPGHDDNAPGDGHGTLLAGVISQFVPQATIQPVNVFTPLLADPTTTSQAVWNGLDFVSRNPFVFDPVRPGQVDRIVTAAMGFGTTFENGVVRTFETEGVAFRQIPQVVISFKNQLHQFRNLGITPVIAAGQLGTENRDVTEIVDAGGGDVKGASLLSLLNEAVAVTGTYSFPLQDGPLANPLDPPTSPLGRAFGPATLFPNPADPLTFPAALEPITDGDNIIYQNKILAAANRTFTTDFAAPALNIPTFRRTSVEAGNDTMAFQEGGTSLSAGMVAGSFTMLSSALDFFQELAINPVTTNAYLTQPVGARVLDFGPGMIRDLSAYANPDGINSILQWTAVPAVDSNVPGADVVDPPFSRMKPSEFREFARIDVGNAVAAIEASVALAYLFNTGAFSIIDANNNGLITAQEIQNFVDRADTIGMAEAGAMARLLGGTASVPFDQPIEEGRNFGVIATTPVTNNAPLGFTTQLEQPDRPEALNRRFAFLDYAANGELNGAISLSQLEMLAHTLLPAPDSFVIVDQQRSAGNGFLLSPNSFRNTGDLLHILPTYAFVPRQFTARFRNANPAKFGVGRGQPPLQQNPQFGLFQQRGPREEVVARQNNRNNNRTPVNAPPASTSSNIPTTAPPVDSNPEPSNPTADNQRARDQAILDAIADLARANASGANSGTLGNPTPAESAETSEVTPMAIIDGVGERELGEDEVVITEVTDVNEGEVLPISAPTDVDESAQTTGNTNPPAQPNRRAFNPLVTSAPMLERVLRRQESLQSRNVPNQLGHAPVRLHHYQDAFERRRDVPTEELVKIMEQRRARTIDERIKDLFGF